MLCVKACKDANFISVDAEIGGTFMKPEYRVKKVEKRDWSQICEVPLMHTGWLEPCMVEARAQACYDDNALWIRMEAQESPIRAMLTGELDSVCTDSCLEFFFAPDQGDRRYFNFEFNPLGTIYLGFGAERSTRVRQIVRNSRELFHQNPFYTDKGWGIEFKIPLSFVQMYFPGYTFSGESCCNFYKCGDQTEAPHYLAWAPLTSEHPDYHRRQDFGILHFIE